MQIKLKSSQFVARSQRLGRADGFGRRALSLGFAAAFCLVAGLGFAEEPKKTKPKHRNTPLDTILQTRLHADVPEPKPFVKEQRPAPESLHFQPVTGTDPERPKLRTPSELKDLETELEAARIHADKRAGIKTEAGGHLAGQTEACDGYGINVPALRVVHRLQLEL